MPSLTQLAFAILLCLSCAFAAPINHEKRHPAPLNWGGWGGNGDGLGSLGGWIFGGKFPVKRDDDDLNRRHPAASVAGYLAAFPVRRRDAAAGLAKRDPVRMKWGSFGSDCDGLGSLGGWIFGNKFPIRRSPTAAEVEA
ncbi:hypothetical protein Slin15195_G127440 [Septoria linicola]|uniref:Uncharacterized protein n=1 Tax=Septoria linicola TaxID=215465 RepID=A0A9Q9B704_9PEZI|nr:hypothetical protein Slin14017_G083620 [Septoria linicola]USW59425.1 hypothetical protein Slin15195_G127440 [Septoria linicola]